MNATEYPPTPELYKMHAVREKSQAIGEFLDWLREEKNAGLCIEHEHTEGCGLVSRHDRGDICGQRSGDLLTFHYGTEKLLAEFFEIDLNKVEAERRAILEHLQPA